MAIYHLTAATGTIRGGQSGAAKHDYVAREGDYAKREDKLMHAESAHMPQWAQADARAYWDAADTHERSNGRLFKYVEFALPRELTLEQNIALSREFAMQLTKGIDGGNLPFTFGVHEGKGHNPHCHLIISERVNDGIERGPDVWFKRVATGKNAKPENGGARKSAALKRNEWLEDTRALWARVANAALAAAGHDARIDHRTLTAQRDEALAKGDHERAKQLDRAPGEHMGPKAKAFEARTGRKSLRRHWIEERRRSASTKLARVRTIDSVTDQVRDRLRDDEKELRAEISREARQRAERARETPQPTKPAAAPSPAPAIAPAIAAARPRRQPTARQKPAPKATSRLARALGAGQAAMHGMARWAQDSIRDLEKLGNAIAKRRAQHEQELAEKQRAEAKNRRQAAKPATSKPVASRPQVAQALAELRPAAPSQAPAGDASARAGQPASPKQDSSGDDRRQRLGRQMNRALETGKSLHIGLAAAAELGDRKAVDKLIENGAAVLPDSLDAAAKRGDDDMFKKLVGAEGTGTNHVALQELARQCGPEARLKLEALAKQAKAQGGHTAGLGIDGPAAPSSSGPKAGAGMAGPK